MSRHPFNVEYDQLEIQLYMPRVLPQDHFPNHPSRVSRHFFHSLAKDKDKKKSPKLLNPVKTDERGPRGHFYYATKCEDCFYKAD